jgi:hypothetical protein
MNTQNIYESIKEGDQKNHTQSIERENALMKEQIDQLLIRVRALEYAAASERGTYPSLVEQESDQDNDVSITWVDDEGGTSALLDDDGHKWELTYSSPHSKRNNALRRQQRVHRDGETGGHDTEFCWVNAWALKKIEGEVCHLGYSCSGAKGKIVWRRCSLKGGRYVAEATTEEKEHVALLSE